MKKIIFISYCLLSITLHATQIDSSRHNMSWDDQYSEALKKIQQKTHKAETLNNIKINSSDLKILTDYPLSITEALLKNGLNLTETRIHYLYHLNKLLTEPYLKYFKLLLKNGLNLKNSSIDRLYDLQALLKPPYLNHLELLFKNGLNVMNINLTLEEVKF